ncbi:hypothetical protein ARMGADRAFT_1105667 [Armillaria gallica]|uniref:Uncharacterized protein n=1 Tax=Armillaria gallica TaxID=47427 RepID=A0A2H3C7R5_ARMGA|nr:hypothetical protein ARMGADRAFT_1105671 [Armillaria gallica]PBK79106.1 hypothetical protein ARMGADRAFT_1105667 [Armillaria gallica]
MNPSNSRKCVSSLPSLKTATENVVDRGEGKGGFEDAVMARKTLGNLTMGGVQGIKGWRMMHISPPSLLISIDSSTSASSATGTMGKGERPNFERVLAPLGGSKRVSGDESDDGGMGVIAANDYMNTTMRHIRLPSSFFFALIWL